jgi:hypothetical protein
MLEIKANEMYRTESGSLVNIVAINDKTQQLLYHYAIGWKIDPSTGLKTAYSCSRSGETDPSVQTKDNIMELAIDGFDVRTFAVVATGLGNYPKGFILHLTNKPEEASKSHFFKDSVGHWKIVELTGKL